MRKFTLEAEAGQVSAELANRGIAGHVHVQVVVEILDGDTTAMSAIAQAGRGLDWLADEPDLYTDADLVPQRAG